MYDRVPNTFDPHLRSVGTSARRVATSDATTIVLVDSHALVREAMSEVLRSHEDLHLVGNAADDESAVIEVARKKPHVVLLNIDAWNDEITGAVARMREVSPESHIIVLSTIEDPQLLDMLLSTGIRTYLVKSVSWPMLIAAIRGCRTDRNHILLVVTENSLPQSQTRTTNLLSPRELEVLELVARAMSNVQIATQLLVSEATIKRHLRNIFVKLGAVSRIDAVNKAVAARLLSPRASRHPS